MDFQTYLKEKAEQINISLEQLFDSWEKRIDGVDSRFVRLVQETRKISQGGKRLRGALVCLSYEIFSGEQNNPAILKPAISFELFQNAILAHDDIIDKSPLRRGKPTLYYALGADHYALSQTICLGDVGFFMATHILADADFPEENKNQAVRCFTETMTKTAFGEVMDIELPTLKEDKTEEDATKIFIYKTSWYTLIGPMRLGAILAGAGEEHLKAIKEFGLNLGIAFQIQDDILGVFGDEQTIGKSVTSDIEEGKITLLYLEALKKANPEQKEFLNKYYGKGQIGEEEVSQIRQIFTETGALDYSKEKALKYIKEAQAYIPQITDKEAYKNILEEMSEFLVNRSK